MNALFPDPCPQICSGGYDPVCASNGETYSNECNFKAEKCQPGQQDLEIIHDGPCKNLNANDQEADKNNANEDIGNKYTNKLDKELEIDPLIPNYCDVKKEFQCLSGKCVPIGRKCDTFDDCDDGSDELDCNKNDEIDDDYYYCDALDLFECEVGKCVPDENVCDGNVDCQNGQDEKHCEEYNFYDYDYYD